VINVILRKPRGDAPTEPLIPLASRRNFIVNYDLAAPDGSLQQASLARAFDAAAESLTVISASDSGLLTPANQGGSLGRPSRITPVSVDDPLQSSYSLVIRVAELAIQYLGRPT
jgi:hypothetical protein